MATTSSRTRGAAELADARKDAKYTLLTPSGKQPDGVTLILGSCGRRLTWDLTASHTFATLHLRAVTSNGAGEANRAAAAKRWKYAAISRTHGFLAVALESSGGA